ncbi:MAG: ATP-binding cassette domain-containing protein [Lachnospiraceae bacterium]|nr:ATP-binding cassette domain-containing protein [Lachnospiraceae bacterium]
MGLYTNNLRKKEENNIKLEKYADDALISNRSMFRLEESIEDVQTALIYMLERFGVSVSRIPAQDSLESLFETMLDPLGMMYEERESVAEMSRDGSENLLAFREDGKAVVLMPSIRGYRYYCPFDSSEGLATKSYIASLRPGCYTLSRPLEKRSTLLRTFIYNVLHTLTVYDVMKLVIATGLVTGLGYILPLVSKWIYNVYIKGNGSAGGFQLAMVTFFMVSLGMKVLSMVKGVMLSRTKIRVSARMQEAVMAKVLHLPQEFFHSTSSGKISRRITNCGRLSDIILQIIMDVLLDLSFSIIYLYQMEGFSPRLFVPAVIFLVAKIIAAVLGALSYAYNEAGILRIDMENSGFLYSVIRGIQKIKGMGAEKAVYSKWADLYRQKLLLTYQQPFFLKYNTEILSAISIATTIGLLGVSMQNGVTDSEYMTFVGSYSLIIIVISSLTDIMQNIFLIQTLCGNIRPVFEADNEESEAQEYVRRLNGDISAENIHFSYDDDPRGCLKGVTINIRRGERVAIVGESGCGKTTLLKVLLGIEIPSEGKVSYDGKPLNSLNLRSLRRRVGSVFQFSRVFPGTIADNVMFGSTGSYDENKIWEALDNADIGDYVRELPLKLDTEISESASSGISGGQRQRILLARAFMDNPRVLILDEATSALDNMTQAAVMKNIQKMKATVVMVAHRLSTIENFDRIIMLRDGVIVEEGNYEELIKMDGKFAGLVRKQQLNEKRG